MLKDFIPKRWRVSKGSGIESRSMGEGAACPFIGKVGATPHVAVRLSALSHSLENYDPVARIAGISGRSTYKLHPVLS